MASPRMRAAAAVLLAMLLPALAGCTTAEAGSAIASRPRADEAARSWQGDAQLAGVMGLEGAFAGAGAMFMAWMGREDVDWSRTRADPQVGDGKAELWVYFYVKPGERRGYVVAVDRDGNVVKRFEGPAPADARPVGEWRINSDEAVRIAKEANQGLRTGLESQRWGIMEALRADPDRGGRATWSIMGGGGDGSGGGGGWVVLDAVTGEVLESRGGFGTMPGT